MLIHIEIANAFQFEIKSAVPCKALEHVIEKSDTCRHAVLPGSINIQAQRDLRLQRIALNRRHARRVRGLGRNSDLLNDVTHASSLSSSRTPRFHHLRGNIDEQHSEEHAPHNHKRCKVTRVLETVDAKKPNDPEQWDERRDHQSFAAAWHLIQTPALRWTS
jgi:hypothetical protein